MSNPLLNEAADVLNAISALRLKTHRLVSTSQGVEIHQPGRPVLLLTHAAAADFAHQIEEARHG